MANAKTFKYRQIPADLLHQMAEVEDRYHVSAGFGRTASVPLIEGVSDRVLQALTPEQRLLLALGDQKLSSEEIGEIAGMSVANVNRRVIELAIMGLPTEFRDTVVLDTLGMPYQEIADALEIPLNTVRHRISRGRKLLQKALWSYLNGEETSTAGMPRDKGQPSRGLTASVEPYDSPLSPH